MTSTRWRAIAVQRRTWAWSRPKQSLLRPCVPAGALGAPPAAQRVSGGQARPLSWPPQPPSVLLLSRTHDREAAAPCRTTAHRRAPLVKPSMAATVLGVRAGGRHTALPVTVKNLDIRYTS
jgi:hypothetical protein